MRMVENWVTKKMFVLSQSPFAAVARARVVAGGALSTQRCSLDSALKHTNPMPPLFSTRRRRLLLTHAHTRRKSPLCVVNPEANGPVTNTSRATNSEIDSSASLVGEESVPLEGVIQFEKPSFSARLDRWGRVALLAGGDVLALLLFSAIGRFSHGFSVLDMDTVRTADPFIAGWLLSAYFLGGYGEDGRGMNGLSQAFVAAAKSWSVGIPLGILIRAAAAGHIPPANFILVTMGSTSILLIGWRTLVFSIFPSDKRKKSDVYKRGSPFELFELLTSLIRRW